MLRGVAQAALVLWGAGRAELAAPPETGDVATPATTETEPSEAPPSVPEVQPAATGNVLMGVVPGDATFDRPELAVVLREHLAGSGLEIHVVSIPATSLLGRLQWAQTAAREADRHAVFWLEPVGDEHRLYLLEPQQRQLWVRALPRATEPALALEQVGLMVRGLATTLEPGIPVEGLSPATPPPTPPAPVVAPAPPAGPTELPRVDRRIAVGLEYTGGNLDDVAPWQHGVGSFVEVEHHTGAFVRLGAGYVVPQRRTEVVELTLHRLPFRLEAGYRFAEHRRVRPEVGGGLTAEVAWWNSHTTPGVRGLAGTSGRLALLAGAGLRVHIGRGLGFHVLTQLEVWLINLDLVADLSPKQTLLHAHPASGSARAGFYIVF